MLDTGAGDLVVADPGPLDTAIADKDSFVLSEAGDTTFVGRFAGDLDTGGAAPATLPAEGSADLALLRYDAGGTLAWSRRVGGPTLADDTTLTAVAQAPSGFAVAGYASAGADFGAPGAGALLGTTGRFVTR